jgi:hypothetical protein
LIVDAASLLVIIGIFISCAAMVVRLDQFSFATPWIAAACLFLSVVSVLLFCNIGIKWVNVRGIANGNTVFRYKFWLHMNYVAIILLLMMIMRDAVTQSTLF